MPRREFHDALPIRLAPAQTATPEARSRRKTIPQSPVRSAKAAWARCIEREMPSSTQDVALKILHYRPQYRPYLMAYWKPTRHHHASDLATQR